MKSSASFWPISLLLSASLRCFGVLRYSASSISARFSQQIDWNSYRAAPAWLALDLTTIPFIDANHSPTICTVGDRSATIEEPQERPG
jgi:hypothetical protein